MYDGLRDTLSDEVKILYMYQILELHQKVRVNDYEQKQYMIYLRASQNLQKYKHILLLKQGISGKKYEQSFLAIRLSQDLALIERILWIIIKIVAQIYLPQRLL